MKQPQWPLIYYYGTTRTTHKSQEQCKSQKAHHHHFSWWNMRSWNIRWDNYIPEWVQHDLRLITVAIWLLHLISIFFSNGRRCWNVTSGIKMHISERTWLVAWKYSFNYCPACRTSLIATRFWVVMICPIIKCPTVLEFSFILLDLCLFITIFNFILNYVPTVTFWIFTYHKIWILLIIFCFIWNYWIIYFLTCFEVFWSVVS